jgi:hypothetical protein
MYDSSPHQATTKLGKWKESYSRVIFKYSHCPVFKSNEKTYKEIRKGQFQRLTSVIQSIQQGKIGRVSVRG